MDHYLKIYNEAMDSAEYLKTARRTLQAQNDPRLVVKTTAEMNELYKTTVSLRSMQELKALNSADAQAKDLLEQLRNGREGL